MKYIKIILCMIWISALAACTTVGSKSASTYGTSVSKQTERVKTETTTEVSSEESNVAVASPIEAVKTYESEPVVQPSVTMSQPKAITPTPVHINARQGLTINMGYQQAWSQTGRALSQAGYPVMEQDNSSGTYYILDKIGTGGVIKRDTPIYQLHLQKTTDNKTIATLNNAQNQPADDGVVQRILGALKNKLGV